MSLFSENSAWDNEPAFRQPEDSRLESKPEVAPIIGQKELERWYRELDNIVRDLETVEQVEPLDPLRDVRDEIYSYLRG